MKIKESENIDKYLDITRELTEHESNDYTIQED